MPREFWETPEAPAETLPWITVVAQVRATEHAQSIVSALVRIAGTPATDNPYSPSQAPTDQQVWVGNDWGCTDCAASVAAEYIRKGNSLCRVLSVGVSDAK
jgi:hypothetical protein